MTLEEANDEAASHPTNQSLYRSTNQAASFSSVSSWKEVRIGYGAPKPGGTGAVTNVIVGWKTGTFSTYGTYYDPTGDLASQANAIPIVSGVTLANGTFSQPSTVAGDPGTYGRFYICWWSTTCAYADTQDACPWVAFTPSFYPGLPVSGTMNVTATASGLPQVTIQNVNFYIDGTLIGSQTSPSSGLGTRNSSYGFTQSWSTSALASGPHWLTLATSGNLTNNPNCTVNAFNGTVVSGTLTVNSGTPPVVGDVVNYLGQPGGGLIVTGGSNPTFTVLPAISQSATNMVAAGSIHSIPVTK